MDFLKKKLFAVVNSIENVILCCSDVNTLPEIVLLVAETAFSINPDLSESSFVRPDALVIAFFEFETIGFCVCGDSALHLAFSMTGMNESLL